MKTSWNVTEKLIKEAKEDQEARKKSRNNNNCGSSYDIHNVYDRLISQGESKAHRLSELRNQYYKSKQPIVRRPSFSSFQSDSKEQ